MNKMDWQFRFGLVRLVVDEYVHAYTSATMAESYGQVVGGQKDADDWLNCKRLVFNITDKEMNNALDSVYKELKESGSACCYNSKLFRKEDENE